MVGDWQETRQETAQEIGLDRGLETRQGQTGDRAGDR
jgi:hypothetical protein